MAGLLGSMFTGSSGLRAASIGVSVVGDNIANTNTVGFKGSRAHFAEMMGESIIGITGSDQVGRGVTLERIEKLFTQGSIKHTGIPTDLAISGNGFFVLGGIEGEAAGNQYTRAGQFRFDENGVLISQEGRRVQGYSADEQGVVSAGIGDIQLLRRNLEPQPTTQIDMHANLRPDDDVLVFDAADADGTSTYRATVVAYDSLGNAHEMTIYGTRTAENTWEMNAQVDGGEIVGGAAGVVETIALGELVFDDHGRLDEENIANPLAIAWLGAAAGAVEFNFGDSITTEGGTGVLGTSQWNNVSQSDTSYIGQDGYGTGTLDHLSVDPNGVLSGSFSNGHTMVLAQVAIAKFEDPTELRAVGGNNFLESVDSGVANIGSAQSGGRGQIVSSALELSNVEMSDEFIDLIAYQRAFQANSRTIQTADGLIQEVMQLLR